MFDLYGADVLGRHQRQQDDLWHARRATWAEAVVGRRASGSWPGGRPTLRRWLARALTSLADWLDPARGTVGAATVPADAPPGPGLLVVNGRAVG